MIVALSLSAWAQSLLASPNLIPAGPNQSPDYFCTWNVQGYVCSYADSSTTRREMVERNLFGHDKYQDWIDFYQRFAAASFWCSTIPGMCP